MRNIKKAITKLKKTLTTLEDCKHHYEKLSMNDNMGVNGRRNAKAEFIHYSKLAKETQEAIECLEMDLISRSVSSDVEDGEDYRDPSRKSSYSNY